MKLAITFLALIYLYSVQCQESIIMNCYYISENESYITNTSNKRDENALASAIYNKTYETIGWDYLSISTYEKNDSKYNDSMKAYAMGYLEGILTKDRIYPYYNNFHKYFLSNVPDEAIPMYYQFMVMRLNYMKEKSLENMEEDPYWEFVHYMYQQIIGIYEGYNTVAEEGKKLELGQIITIAGISDAQDYGNYLIRKLMPNFKEMSPEEKERYLLLNSHCSALVKLAKDWSDIWFGHNTWNNYVLMIRIFKEYRFVTNKGNEKSKTIAFSSYPCAVSSPDEFHLLDSNLVQMGTSINILKDELYDLIAIESIGSSFRQMLAGRLASSAEEWTKIFARENSGTCNEQAIILDMNKIDFKNKKIEDKALMIIEQMPNKTETKDVTEYLRKGHWPSYNVPFIDTIYKDLGYYVNETSEGVYENVEYTQSERALIFKRDQGNINSKEEFKKFMRYNDYKNDNISHNDPSKAISARHDLGDGNNTVCGGGIDSKFISVKELLEKKNLIYIISGPTNDQQETFSWSNHTCRDDKDRLSYTGINDVWNFPWINYNIQLFDNKKNEEEKKVEPIPQPADKSYIYWIIGSVSFAVVVAIIIIIVVVYKKKSNKEISSSLLESDNNEIQMKQL